ncbi:hypothetical protein GCM10027355_35410 [Haloplanus salinarum]
MRMNQFYLYHLSLGVMGAVWGLSAVWSILADGMSLPLGLAGVGGVGLVVAVVYELATAAPEEFSVGRVSFGLVITGAVLTLVGAGLELI